MRRLGVGPVAPAPPATDPFRSLLPRACVIAGVTHVGFLVYFLVTGEPVLVAVNIASIACYVVLFELVRRNNTKPIVEFSIVAAELFTHAVVATIIVGWDSGFHYYLLLLIPINAVSAIRPLWVKTAAVSISAFGYLALDLWLRPVAGDLTSADDSGTFLYAFNLLSTLLILAVLAGGYYVLIQRAQAALQVVATTDPLTQLHNRHSLSDLIRHHESRAQRGHPLSFVMCDIDHFKSVNDLGGHAAGDAVLQAVSRAMVGSVRDIDFIGRWGGEEFLVLLPDADAAGAALVAERLRRHVAALELEVEGGPPGITITVGVSALAAGETAAEAIARADVALYEGKRSGRNRVVMAAEPSDSGRDVVAVTQ